MGLFVFHHCLFNDARFLKIWWSKRGVRALAPPQIELVIMRDIYPNNNRSKILCAAKNHLLLFTQKDMAEWLTGSRKRVKAVEKLLPQLVVKKKLKAVRYGRKLVYRLNHPRLQNGITHLEHDLMCTKLIILFGAQEIGEIVSELFFLEQKEQFCCVPDWAVLFPNMVMLCEYSTSDNFRRTHLMRKKLKAYRKHLFRFIDYFDNDVSVLFILDAPRHKVNQFALDNAVPNDRFAYFTDLASVLQAPKSELLTTPLFIWGGDGQEKSLTS
ncbi:MAG: hypothetical protein IPM53_18215 [Anaerolineaceae bacterium]|nr:hypothetical protein [Anaerolineaceae bacterium]